MVQNWNEFDESFGREQMDIYEPKTGDVIRVVKDFNEGELDFKKTGTNWYARNISSLRNMHAKVDANVWEEGQLLFVSLKDGIGYEAYSPSHSMTHNEYRLLLSPHKLQDWKKHMIALALEKGFVVLTNINDENFTKEEESEIKVRRIQNAMSKGIVLFRNIDVTSLEHDSDRNIFTVYGSDLETQKKSQDFILRDILREKFTKENGEEITGDLTDQKQIEEDLKNSR